MLKEKTKLIKEYCSNAKNNFLNIGKLLIEIRNKELWKEEYNSFTEYLISEDFEFTKGHAYRLMDVYEKFGNVVSTRQLGLAKLMELSYVPDKEKREELTEKVLEKDLSLRETREEVEKVREEDLFKQIKRKSQREDEDIVIESDEPLLKCKRLAKEILQDIKRLEYPLSNMKIRLEKWIMFSYKFKRDKEIQVFKAAIFLEWKKIRELKIKVRQKGDEDWFD